MKLLNVGCGGQRPQEEHWWNLDQLREFLKPGTPERTNLDAEPRYIECNLLTESIHVPDQTFDGILLQHVLEHFTCHETTEVLGKCRAVLKEGGLLVASVPDARYFKEMIQLDNRANAVKLFGEPISEPEHDSFFSYALWHKDHKQILTDCSLWALLIRAGFLPSLVRNVQPDLLPVFGSELVEREIRSQLNRKKFSVVMWAKK